MKEPKSPRPFLIMGIVNVTPDSFSDGGRWQRPEDAVSQALRLAEDGADIIDLGAESTRPGAAQVTEAEEWARLEPVLQELVSRLPPKVSISVDTRKPNVMFKAALLGVRWINNVAGLAADAVLHELAKIPNLSYIAMHMHKEPTTMQQAPLKGPEALTSVENFFVQAHAKLTDAGFSPNRIYLDPGIGFGKDDQANLQLMAQTPKFAEKYSLVLGVSRKAWLGRLLGIKDAQKRDDPSKIAEFALALAGAQVIRTHEVKRLAHLREVFFI